MGEDIEDIMWLKKPRYLCLNADLAEFLEEHSWSCEGELGTDNFAEFWELVLEWQKEVQK